jgi:DNA polymerase-3 subunit epsilon
MKSILKLIFGPSKKPQDQTHSENPKTQTPLANQQLKTLLQRTYRFIAIDVETANKDQGSICQIGIALVSADGNISAVSIMINPEQHFDEFNVNLHGIDNQKVKRAMNFPKALQMLRPLLERHLLIQHSTFDRRAFDAACDTYDIPKLRSKWFDSVQIARKAWPELKGNGGHGLANLKQHLNLVFNHHDAKEDAKAAAQVTLLAETITGKTFDELAQKSQMKYEQAVVLEGNQNGALYGHTACFTGKLNMSRADAATYAAGAGISVKAGVSKKITLLIVGDQDITLLAGHTKSSKHRYAEELITQGQKIKILGESEFLNLIKD